MSENNLKLSVVIPSYNESAQLKKEGIDEVFAYLKSVNYPYEVLIVDDGSTNNTRQLVKDYIKDKKGFKLLENEHGGKALTVMAGMLEAAGEIAVFTDMDQATPIKEIENFFPKFEEGFDVVIGSRHGRKGAPITRKIVAWGFALLRNILLGLPFSDTQCGFKALTKKSRDQIFNQMQKEWSKTKTSGAAVNAGFDVEILFIAKKLGYKISEVDVIWTHKDVGSRQVRVINEAISALKDMVRIRINDLHGRYSFKS